MIRATGADPHPSREATPGLRARGTPSGPQENPMNFLAGYKTYLVAAILILVVAAEKGLGLDVPGVALQDDWLLVVLNALGLGALRAGITAR